MAPLVTEMAQRFEKLYPTIRVDVSGGGSGKGVSDLRSGTSSIVMVSRVLLDIPGAGSRGRAPGIPIAAGTG